MKGEAIGLVEVRGFAAATKVADIAAKTANIDILGYEETKGSGHVVVKISGEVSAVTVAIEAVEAQRFEIGTVVASKVIAKPHDDLNKLLVDSNTN